MEERTRTILDGIGQAERLTAAAFHDAAEAALRAAGISTSREVIVPIPGRRRARVDLVLDDWFALELDRKSPRKRSLAKIRAFGAGMVYCRW